MKILLLNQTFHPDVVATAQYLSELAAALAARGHEVTVVAGRRGYDNPNQEFPARENWRGLRIYRIGSTRFGKSAKWRRAADFASFLFNCCACLAFLPRQDVVVALTSPPLISFIAACFARWRGGKFVYWVMDLNPDEAVAAGWLRSNSFAGRCLEKISRFSFRSATRIIALDRFMAGRIEAKGIETSRITVIPPWAHDDEVRFDPEGRQQFRAAHGLSDKFVVMYSGNHSPCHPLDTLLQAAKRSAADDGIHFCFVGGGSEFKRVQAFAAHHGLRNILSLPYQPLRELAASLSAADAHVVVVGDPFVGIVHPCKIYNMLAVGAPVIYIGPEPSHVTEILEARSVRHPWFGVRHGEVEVLARQIRDWRKAAGQRQFPTDLLANFSRAALLPRLVASIEQTVQKG